MGNDTGLNDVNIESRLWRQLEAEFDYVDVNIVDRIMTQSAQIFKIIGVWNDKKKSLENVAIIEF